LKYQMNYEFTAPVMAFSMSQTVQISTEQYQ
jgi:hypothetical protein